MIKFIADSSCDTRKYNDTNIDIASLKIYTEERDYLDDENLDIHEMLDYLLNYKDRSYTACPSTESWLNAFDFIENEVKHYLSSTRLFFAFKSLHNLAQNGRVNKIVASLIGKLNISIIGTASTEGTIEPITKSRGVKNVFAKLIEEMTVLNKFYQPDNPIINDLAEANVNQPH